MSNKVLPTADGWAKPATAEDIERDDSGYTAPNLHRRIVPEDDVDIQLLVSGNNSIRMTITPDPHDEDSETCEIP